MKICPLKQNFNYEILKSHKQAKLEHKYVISNK